MKVKVAQAAQRLRKGTKKVIKVQFFFYLQNLKILTERGRKFGWGKTIWGWGDLEDCDKSIGGEEEGEGRKDEIKKEEEEQDSKEKEEQDSEEEEHDSKEKEEE